MRIHNRATLVAFIDEFPPAEKALRAWYAIAKEADWANSNELKEQLGNASIINKKRVVFNIHGNKFRLVADVEYTFQKIFIIWFGTHNAYDKIEIEELKYVKINKD